MAQAKLTWENSILHLKEVAELHKYEKRAMDLRGFLRPRILEERRGNRAL